MGSNLLAVGVSPTRVRVKNVSQKKMSGPQFVVTNDTPKGITPHCYGLSHCFSGFTLLISSQFNSSFDTTMTSRLFPQGLLNPAFFKGLTNFTQGHFQSLGQKLAKINGLYPINARTPIRWIQASYSSCDDQANYGQIVQTRVTEKGFALFSQEVVKSQAQFTQWERSTNPNCTSLIPTNPQSASLSPVATTLVVFAGLIFLAVGIYSVFYCCRKRETKTQYTAVTPHEIEASNLN